MTLLLHTRARQRASGVLTRCFVRTGGAGVVAQVAVEELVVAQQPLHAMLTVEVSGVPGRVGCQLFALVYPNAIAQVWT